MIHVSLHGIRRNANGNSWLIAVIKFVAEGHFFCIPDLIPVPEGFGCPVKIIILAFSTSIPNLVFTIVRVIVSLPTVLVFSLATIITIGITAILVGLAWFYILIALALIAFFLFSPIRLPRGYDNGDPFHAPTRL